MRTLSPLESAIDAATGFDREAFERQKKAENEAGTEALLQSADAIFAWFKCHRPLGWSQAKHLGQPHVNCFTDAEKRLADCAILLIKARLVGPAYRGVPPAKQ